MDIPQNPTPGHRPASVNPQTGPSLAETSAQAAVASSAEVARSAADLLHALRGQHVEARIIDLQRALAAVPAAQVELLLPGQTGPIPGAAQNPGASAAVEGWVLRLLLSSGATPIDVLLRGKDLPAGWKPGDRIDIDVLSRFLLQLRPASPTFESGNAVRTTLDRATIASLARWMGVQGDLTAALRQLETLQSAAPDRLRQPLQHLLHTIPLPRSEITLPGRLEAALQASAGNFERSLLHHWIRTAEKPPQGSLPGASAMVGQPGSNRSLANVLGEMLTGSGRMSPAPAGTDSTAMQQTGRGAQPLLTRLQHWLQNAGNTSPAHPVPAAPGATGTGLTGVPADPGRELLPGSLKARLLDLWMQLQRSDPRQADSVHGTSVQRASAHLPAGADAGTMEQPLLFPFKPPPNMPTLGTGPGALAGALVRALARIHVQNLQNVRQGAALSAAAMSSGGTTAAGAAPGVEVASGTPVWLAELPIRSDRLDTVQLRIERDTDESDDRTTASKTRQWRVVLGFHFEQTGPFQAQITYRDGVVSAVWWTEDTPVMGRLTEHLPQLREQLVQWGMHVEGLEVRRGAPRLPEQPIQQRFVDEEA